MNSMIKLYFDLFEFFIGAFIISSY